MTKHGLSIAQRLELHYIPEPNSGCWLWTGALKGNGYPILLVDKKYSSAHRIIFQLYKGTIPKGMEVCHTCDVPICVNPDHLYVGTHAQNMQDASRKKRFPLRQGSLNPHAKLTEKEVSAIRSDSRSCPQIAAVYGVDRTLIWQIKKNKIWRHL